MPAADQVILNKTQEQKRQHPERARTLLNRATHRRAAKPSEGKLRCEIRRWKRLACCSRDLIKHCKQQREQTEHQNQTRPKP
ncbi:MAG: hypothetical protein EBW39_13125 [Betaproteobacteria bacterium]|nr:hypothetical protein [Betaproteobacteria bacterium]